MNRDQSPISTVNASPVSAEMPRRQPSRLTGSAKRAEAATSRICSSRRLRAAVAASTASKLWSKAALRWMVGEALFAQP